MHGFTAAWVLFFIVRAWYTASLSRERGVLTSTTTHKVLEAKWSALATHGWVLVCGTHTLWFLSTEVRMADHPQPHLIVIALPRRILILF